MLHGVRGLRGEAIVDMGFELLQTIAELSSNIIQQSKTRGVPARYSSRLVRYLDFL